MCRGLFLVLLGTTGLSGRAIAQGPIAAPITKGNVRIELELVADDLTAPHYLTHAHDNSGRLFIVDQRGDILLNKNGVQQSTPYFSVNNLLVNTRPGFDERGLIGMAFHPDFANQGTSGFGKFYTNTSEPTSGAADFPVSPPTGDQYEHQGVIREWTVDPTQDVISGSPVSRELLRVDQPQFNHNGGALVFGPDKNLYIGYGDGGGGGDDEPGHGPIGNGQNINTILGSIARIDPFGNNSANGNYGVPADNPFVGQTGVDEIYAYGVRNPFQFNFDVDAATGLASAGTTERLIVADVGQSNIEEVDVVNLGDNLGWRYKEGSFFYDPTTNAVSETPFPGIVLPSGFAPVDPVLEYDHDEGRSIVGGFIYRGTELPELEGKYVFADFTTGGFASSNGRLFYGDLDTGEINEFILGFDDRALGLFNKGIGRGPDGELYLIAGSNLGPFRDPVTNEGFGSVFKIVRAVPEPSSVVMLAALSGAVILRRRSKAS